MTYTTQSLMLSFSEQMRALDPTRATGNMQPLELLLEDGLPLRITLHPDNRYWVIEAFAYNAVAIHGPLRRSLVKTLLRINAAALEGRQVICTLDQNDQVVLMTRWLAEESDPNAFLPWLEYSITQARRIREAVRAIAMHGDDLDWQPANLSGAAA